MKTSALLALIFGILLLIGGFITLGLFALGESNSTTDGDIDVGEGQYYTVGGKMASKIICEFEATRPIDVYVTTDENAMGLLWSIESLDDEKKISSGKSSGKIEYETPDSGEEYYLIFFHPNGESFTLSYDIEFQNDVSMVCLSVGTIILIAGIVLMILAFMINKKSRVEYQQMHGAGGYPQQGGYGGGQSSYGSGQSYYGGGQSSYGGGQSYYGGTQSSYGGAQGYPSQQSSVCHYCQRPMSYDYHMRRYYCPHCERGAY